MNRSIGFDMTNVITRWPDACRELIKSLAAAGWQVYVVSPNDITSIHADLLAAGIDESWLTAICNRGDKGLCCKELSIGIILDDHLPYLEQVMAESPVTLPLLVLQPK